MNANLRKRSITHPIKYYWGMVKNMDNSQKLELMTLLIESMKPAAAESTSGEREPNIDDYYGIWNDEEYMDAKEMVKAIRDGRHVKSSRDEFWNML